jgi:hypothetical protein
MHTPLNIIKINKTNNYQIKYLGLKFILGGVFIYLYILLILPPIIS